MSGTPILYGRGLAGQNFYGFLPVGGISPTYPTEVAVYFATASIRIEWAEVIGATLYRVEVSQTPDFSGTLLKDTTTSDRFYEFTDLGTNNTKRWWRIRASFDAGTTYEEWSEIGSYWVNTSGAENVSLDRNTWALINLSPVTDRHVFDLFPMYAIKQRHLYRARERNRAGTMLSEYLTMKGSIQLVFDQRCFMDVADFLEFRRFNEEVKTFFLATLKDNAFHVPVPSIWKVQFETDPELTMFASGRQDLFVGTLTFEEV